MKVLKLQYFDSTVMKRYSLTVPDVRDDLTQDEIQPVAESFIGVLIPATAALDEAHVVESTSTQVFDLIPLA
jgi:Protein of unknown function (DUF2922).